MKHERNIKAEPKQNWRLKKTLARKVGFRPLETEDIRFAWAAYKKGALAPMAGVFADTGMSSDDFDFAFRAVIDVRYHGAWTLFAETKKGYLPVGFVLAFYSHSEHPLSPFMIIGDLIWFPWSSARNRVEAAVNFFNTIRNEIPMVDYAHGDVNKRFFETMAKHGIMRRVGTTFNIVKGEPTAIFETRVG